MVGTPKTRRLCSLGSCYSHGTGVVQNETEALRWYRLAADQGKSEGQFNVDVFYNDGIGVVQNNAGAVRWHRLAADQGDADAQQNLGRHYVYGTGVARDNAAALRWYHLAADQGHAAAQFNIGIEVHQMLRKRHSLDSGVIQDEAEDMRWHHLHVATADQDPRGRSTALGGTTSKFKGLGVVEDEAEAARSRNNSTKDLSEYLLL
jgi:TPR repeat protein